MKNRLPDALPRSLALKVAAFSWAVAAGGILCADEVTLISPTTFKQAIGGKVRGSVQSESPSAVVVALGAGTTGVPSDQILSIRYDNQSPNFALAESRESAGLLAEAAELFRKAAADSAGKPLPLRAALFGEARALCDLALSDPERVKEASDKLTRFIQANANARQIVAARECMARLQLFAGDVPGASATIAEMAKLPHSAERAAVLRTKLLAKQGKYAEAMAGLDRLIASYPKNSARQRSALLAKAENLASTKRFKEAEALLREVIKANPPEDAASQAPAYNTLGDCLRAANRPKDALFAYLHTDVLYSKDKEEHPRALYQIAALFRQLKQDARADEFVQRLKQEYPRSHWLTKAADRRAEQ